jgi:chemotaxis protein MotB
LAAGSEGAVVELGKALGENPDISVLPEGHTDNDPYAGSGPIADNWDLSQKSHSNRCYFKRKQINKRI